MREVKKELARSNGYLVVNPPSTGKIGAGDETGLIQQQVDAETRDLSRLPGPGMAVYHTTKAYVVFLTEALHGELGAEGVRVCALSPVPGGDGVQRPGRRAERLFPERPEPLGGAGGARAMKAP